MQYYLDNDPHMSVGQAFVLADKEMAEKQAEIDLQVTLAREHAARLGVLNQGVEGMLKRANVVYESVYKMKEEEAEKTRRTYLADLCRDISSKNERLDMQDLVDTMPFREEQMQFFKDYPEYRKLFPPLWYMADEIVEAQAMHTERSTDITGMGDEQEEDIVDLAGRILNDMGEEIEEGEEELSSADEIQFKEELESLEKSEDLEDEEDDQFNVDEQDQNEGDENAEDEGDIEEGAEGSGSDGYVESDPAARAVNTWPPEYIFFREQLNSIRREIGEPTGQAREEVELERAKQEALQFLKAQYAAELKEANEEEGDLNEYEAEEGEKIEGGKMERKEIDYSRVPVSNAGPILEVAEKMGKALHEERRKSIHLMTSIKGDESADFLQKAIDKTEKAKRTIDQALEGEHEAFYAKYRAFIEQNNLIPARDRPIFDPTGAKSASTGSEYAKVLDEREQSQNEELRQIIAKYADKNGMVDAKAIKELRKEVKDKFGPQYEDALFELAKDGGAVSARQLSGLAPHNEFVQRHANLVSDIELTPFYPENAFPPRGLLADTTIDLSDPAKIPEKFKKQYEELKAFGAKYAHAVEDHAPVKSKEYIEETLKWGTNIVSETTPEIQPSVKAQAKELLNLQKDFVSKASRDVPKTKEEHEKSLEKAKKENEASAENVELEAAKIQDEVALKKLKQQMLNQLATKAFNSEEERREYELMLEKRYDYLVAKRKEAYEQWAQYWPADKPEALIYRGPEVIREIFPEAYRLAVTRKYEELTDLPLKTALGVKSYVGLWKTVRMSEKRDTNVRDLDTQEWQHQLELEPSFYKDQK